MRIAASLLLILSGIGVQANTPAGARLVYQVAGTSESRFWQDALQRAIDNAPSAPAPPTVLKQSYRYQLSQTAVRESLWVVEWRQWQTDDATQQAFRELLSEVQSLSPVYVRRLPSGGLEFARPTEPPAWARQAIGSILYPFQFVRHPKQREVWETHETHPGGLIRCRYRLVSRDSKQSVYNKAVVEVVLSPEEKQLGKTHRILGYLQYTFDNKGVLVSIRGLLRERVTLAGVPVTHTDTTLNIRLATRTRLSAQQLGALQRRAARVLAQARWHALYAPPTEQEQEYARAQSLLRDETPETLLQALDRALETPVSLSDAAGQQARLELQRKVVAGLILYDDKFAQAVIDRFRQRSSADDGFWLLLAVLSHSSRPKAQHALIAALKESTSPEQQQAIARQLMFVESVSEPLMRDLWAWTRDRASDDVQIMTALSLSALAGRNPDQPLAREIARWCARQLEHTEEPIVWLNILSNLRRPETLPTLERYARTGSEQARQAAIAAMGKLAPADVLPLYQRLYELDPALTVRQKIAEQAVAWWEHPAARQLVERALFNDPEVALRNAIVQSLASVAARDKNALNLLVRVAETNSSPATRREAMVVLAVLRAEGVSVPPVRAAP